MSHINWTSYERIEKGMTYEQVSAILGSCGRQVSFNSAELQPGFTWDTMVTEVYRWTNREGASIMAMFGHGKLREKSQQGLDENQ